MKHLVIAPGCDRVIGAPGETERQLGTLKAWRSSVCSAVAMLRAVLHEIFDESGYARYLTRHGLRSSGDAYAAFLREKSGERPRPRCC